MRGSCEPGYHDWIWTHGIYDEDNGTTHKVFLCTKCHKTELDP